MTMKKNKTVNLTKSKQRIRDFGEVFTPKAIVRDMLDLIQLELYKKPDARFLEPACGDGNFLTEVLERKLKMVAKRYKRHQDEYERNAMTAIASLYGVELLDDNVALAHERLFGIVEQKYRTLYKRRIKEDFLKSARYVIERNIVQGDALTLKDKHDKPIVFSEWTPINTVKIKRQDFTFEEIIPNEIEKGSLFTYNQINDEGNLFFIPKPFSKYPAVHFLTLYKAYDKK